MATPSADARARLGRAVDPAEHRRIRRLRQRGSIAEDRRDIDGLVATLTPDCVYEFVGLFEGERIFLDRTVLAP